MPDAGSMYEVMRILRKGKRTGSFSIKIVKTGG